MSTANIEKTDNTIIIPTKLEPSERRRLKTRVTGHGKLLRSANEIGVNRNTIYNAIAGKNLMPDVLTKIRSFLSN